MVRILFIFLASATLFAGPEDDERLILSFKDFHLEELEEFYSDPPNRDFTQNVSKRAKAFASLRKTRPDSERWRTVLRRAVEFEPRLNEEILFEVAQSVLFVDEITPVDVLIWGRIIVGEPLPYSKDLAQAMVSALEELYGRTIDAVRIEIRELLETGLLVASSAKAAKEARARLSITHHCDAGLRRRANF